MERLFLLILPFNPVFSLHAWIPLTFISAGFLLLKKIIPNTSHNSVVISRGSFTAVKFYFVFVFIFTISLLVNISKGNLVSLNHYVSIILLSFLYYVLVYDALARLDNNVILKFLLIPFLIVVIYGAIDFLILLLFNYSISDSILYFPESYTTSYGMFNQLIRRSKSFFQEPGYFAWYLSSTAPIILYLLNKQDRVKLFSIYSISLISTFSATGVMCLSVFSLGLFKLIKGKYKKIFLGLSFTAIALFYVVPIVQKVIYFKVINESVSKTERTERWLGAYDLFVSDPLFGGGIGNFSIINEFGLSSFPVKILAESGIFSFVILAGMLLFPLYKIIRNYKCDDWLLVLSMIFTMIHWLTSSPFYMAFVWSNFAIVAVLVERRTKL